MWFVHRIVRFLGPLTLSSAIAFGASKEIVELQRDVTLLQIDVRSLQRSLDQNLGAAKALTQRTLDVVNEIHGADVTRNRTAADSLEKLNLTIATLDNRLNQSVSEYMATREAIAALNARLAGLEQKLGDIDRAVSAMRDARTPLPPPGMTAESLFQAAVRDKAAGHLDLALTEFQQYLQHYPEAPLAASSGFYIGEIHYNRRELPLAEEAFTAVIERYPKSGKTADALLMRALARKSLGDVAGAESDLKALQQDYPASDAARRAQTELTSLNRSTVKKGRSR